MPEGRSHFQAGGQGALLEKKNANMNEDLKEVRGEQCGNRGRVSQAEGTASAKALR